MTEERGYLVAHAGEELAYPEAWLLGWRDVLHDAPGDHPMPRVNVIPVKGRNPRPYAGKYVPADHVVYVYANADRNDALCTLIHELAHAWTPDEEAAHHGPRWRQTYAELYGWLTGLEVHLERLPELARDFNVKHGAFKSRRVSSAGVLASMMDLLVTTQLDDLDPKILITHRLKTGAPFAVAACIGDKQHRIRVRP